MESAVRKIQNYYIELSYNGTAPMKKIIWPFINKLKPEILPLVILSFFIFLSVAHLLKDGFFRTFDDVTTVRIMYLVKEFSRVDSFSDFPIRMLAELGNNYAYPLFVYYAPLSYYVGALFMFLGFSHIVATKLVYFLPFVFGSFLFYGAARQKISIWHALVSSVLFSLFPLRGYEIYLRGGVAEAWATNLVPGLFLGIFLIEKKQKYGGIILSLFTALLILSHQIIAVLGVGLIVVYGLLFLRLNKSFWISIAIGIGISAFYWIPCLYYLHDVRLTTLHLNSGEVVERLIPFADYIRGRGLPGLIEGYPTFIPLIPILCLIGLIVIKKVPKPFKKSLLFFGIISILIYSLVFKYSTILWESTIFITGKFQFPFRVLTIACFTISLTVGLFLNVIKKWYLRSIIALIFIGISLTFLPFFAPKEYSFFYEYQPEGPCATTTWEDEYLPIDVKKCASKPPQEVIETSPYVPIIFSKNELTHMEFSVSANQKTEILVNKYYFPGWNIYVNENETDIEHSFSEQGIFRTTIQPGKHVIKVIWEKTFVMWIADIISILFIIIFLIFGIKNVKTTKQN